MMYSHRSIANLILRKLSFNSEMLKMLTLRFDWMMLCSVASMYWFFFRAKILVLFKIFEFVDQFTYTEARNSFEIVVVYQQIRHQALHLFHYAKVLIMVLIWCWQVVFHGMSAKTMFEHFSMGSTFCTAATVFLSPKMLLWKHMFSLLRQLTTDRLWRKTLRKCIPALFMVISDLWIFFFSVLASFSAICIIILHFSIWN